MEPRVSAGIISAPDDPGGRYNAKRLEGGHVANLQFNR